MEWIKNIRQRRIETATRLILVYLKKQGFTQDIYNRMSKQINDALRVTITFNQTMLRIEVANTLNNKTNYWSLDISFFDILRSGMAKENLIRYSIMDAVNARLFDNI